MPLLVDVLKDQEEKTRANAAGALGNFFRNSEVQRSNQSWSSESAS